MGYGGGPNRSDSGSTMLSSKSISNDGDTLPIGYTKQAVPRAGGIHERSPRSARTSKAAVNGHDPEAHRYQAALAMG